MKLGKRTKTWNKDRAKLKLIYQEKGITTCELRFEGCWVNNALGFAHKHKRSYYLLWPDQLGTFTETILACNPCHQKIEYDKKLTEEMFDKLRPTT